MMRSEFWPPNRNHCTIVTGVLSLPLMASMRVSYPGWPSMRTGSDIVIRPSRTPGIVVAICWAETSAVVGLRGRGSDQADDHEGRGFEAALFVAIGQDQGGARRQRADRLEIAELGHLERHQPELLVDRNLVADHGGCEHLADGVVGVDPGGVLRHLHGDVAGEGRTRHDHRVAPDIGGAVLGVFGGVVGQPRRRLDALRLDAAGAAGIGLEGIGDLAIGLGGQVRHQHLDALILGLEADE